MTKIGVLIRPSLRKQLFAPETLRDLETLGTVTYYDKEDRPTPEDAVAVLKDATVCVGSWGMPKFDEELLSQCPELRAIVYCAGSVKAFVTDSVWERGIRVTSGAPSIATGVAEYTVGLAILARRNAFRLHEKARRKEPGKEGMNELWGSTVGIVSLGQVGRKVAEYMKPFQTELLGFDPYVSAEDMAALGVTKVELDELLRRSDIVTLHTPALPETERMLTARELKLMKDNAVLINTARGSVIDEDDLVAELQTGRIFACLDVINPEPEGTVSPLRTLPNVFITPHIAGPPTRRLGLQGVEEVRRFLAGEPAVYEMTKERLSVTA